MGKIQRVDVPRSGLIDLHILVRRDVLRRLDAAADAMDQTRSSWIRLAIVEKLSRSGDNGNPPAA